MRRKNLFARKVATVEEADKWAEIEPCTRGLKLDLR